MTQQAETLSTFLLTPGTEAYVVGSFERGVTVFNQQVRALNLIYSLVENEKIPTASAAGETSQGAKEHKVAIIGGGVSGITCAAALLAKGYAGRIHIFEKRDTIFPLQNGNDTRWLHPRIYDWPSKGSESSSAMLPIMNWCAGRASDVIVQLQTEWRKIVDQRNLIAEPGSDIPAVDLYCNVGHIKITRPEDSKLIVEWIGEQRDYDAKVLSTLKPCGDAKEFDTVIMAVGFGLDGSDVVSYWRNDQFAQPSLDAAKRTFIVSGQGDGAVIDLLRLRISNFRQDRILGDLFPDEASIVSDLREINEKISDDKGNFYQSFQNLEISHKDEIELLMSKLTSRFRRDVELILQIKEGKLADLFDFNKCKMSFQNRFFLYLLYRCGGFTPLVADAVQDIHSLKRKMRNISPTVIMRRGVSRDQIFSEIFDEYLSKQIKNFKERDVTQSPTQKWPGGYFGYSGPKIEAGAEEVGDSIKASWRREYLPAVSEIMAASLCGAISGYLCAAFGATESLRVTLHRSLRFSDEELLQQTCDYSGILNKDANPASVAGRTFPAKNATIGLAYTTERIIRSIERADPNVIKSDMEGLRLKKAARNMRPDVGFLLAIPLMEGHEHSSPSRVWGVLYVDSAQKDFYVNDHGVMHLCRMVEGFTASLQRVLRNRREDVSNTSFNDWSGRTKDRTAESPEVPASLEALENIAPPSFGSEFQYNLDYTDYAVGSGA